MLLFDTFEDAVDLDSECVFCKKSKFVVFRIQNAEGKEQFGVDRCVKEFCDEHCKWDHQDRTYTLDWSDEDHVGMVS